MMWPPLGPLIMSDDTIEIQAIHVACAGTTTVVKVKLRDRWFEVLRHDGEDGSVCGTIVTPNDIELARAGGSKDG
jgi:hypothetical protein